MNQHTYPVLPLARCMLHFDKGAPPVERLAHPSFYEAFAALADAPIDLVSSRRFFGRKYGTDFDDWKTWATDQTCPGALVCAADAALTIATSMRATRFAPHRVPRLDDTFLPMGVSDDSLLSLIFRALWAGLNQHAEIIKDQQPPIYYFFQVAYRYPSIPPSTDATLYGNGFTVAEALATMACTLIVNLADAYAKTDGRQAAEMHRAAKEAKVVADEARRVIERGIAYTLKCSMTVEQPSGLSPYWPKTD